MDRSPPLKDDIDKAVEQKYNEKFQTPKGATVDYSSAAQLVNRYCMSLPSDMFTNPAVQWESFSDNLGNHTVSVLLPIQSSLKEKITVSVTFQIAKIICWH